MPCRPTDFAPAFNQCVRVACKPHIKVIKIPYGFARALRDFSGEDVCVCINDFTHVSCHEKTSLCFVLPGSFYPDKRNAEPAFRQVMAFSK